MRGNGPRRDPQTAALLSGLILPGLGQLYQGKIRCGIALMAATLLCLAVLLVRMVSSVATSLKLGTRGDVSPSSLLATIRAAYEALGSMDAWLLLTILCLWTFSVADALRGRGITSARVKGGRGQGPR